MTDESKISLTPQLRSNWNSFMDHVSSVNGGPNESYLKGFLKDNPDAQLAAEHIPVALSEISNLKAGVPIGNFNPDQAAYIQSGLTNAYKNNPDNLHYPVSTVHGTDLEKHLEVNKQNIVPIVLGPGDKEKVKEAAPEDIIPRPSTFDNPEENQKYRNELYKKYGQYVKYNADLPETVGVQIEGEDKPLGQMAKDSATKLGLKPALLYASAMQEGMRGLIPTAKNKGQVDFSGDDKFPISGYTNFGLDRFYDMYPELEKKGYLPADFAKNFKKSVETPQTGDNRTPVNSANFKDIDSAMQAKAAVLKNTYDHLDSMVKKDNIKLSDKARDFFALVAFNAGESNAEKMLESYSKKGYLKNDMFLNKQPDQYWSGPYKDVIQRIKAAEMLKGEKYF